MKPVTWLGLNGIRTQEHTIALHDALQQSWRHLVVVEFRNRMGSESKGKHWKRETRTEERKPIWLSCMIFMYGTMSSWGGVVQCSVDGFKFRTQRLHIFWPMTGFALGYSVIEFNFTILWISLLISSCRTIFNFSFQFIDPEIGITYSCITICDHWIRRKVYF